MSQQADPPFDLFVSHGPADRAWVRDELLPRLEEAGLRACVEWRDFRPGAPRAREMERAVLDSRKTLLVLSPDYVQSEWAEFGDLMVQALDPAARDLRLIPLLAARCDLPLRIRHLVPVDFTDPGALEMAWRQLLAAVGRADGAPIPGRPPAAQDREPGQEIRAGQGSAAAVGGGAAVVGDGNVVITGQAQGDVTVTQGGGPGAAVYPSAPADSGGYDLAAVRDLLLAAFSAEDLRRLFLYTARAELRPALHTFSPRDGLAEMAEKAIEFCLKQELLPELMGEVEAANPRQYARFEGRLRLERK